MDFVIDAIQNSASFSIARPLATSAMPAASWCTTLPFSITSVTMPAACLALTAASMAG